MPLRVTTVVYGLFILLCGCSLPVTVAAAADEAISSDEDTTSDADKPIYYGVTSGIVFSDNTELEERDKKSEVGVMISPYISLHRKRAGTDLNMTGQLEYNTLGRGSDALNLRLEADATAELREDLTYIDARVTSSQNALDPFAAVGIDAIDRNDNQTATYTYLLSPYALNHYGSFADLLSRYTHSGVVNSNSDNSDSNAVSVALNSGSDFIRIPWGLFGNFRKTENERGSNNELISADVRLGYNFEQKWRVNASLGREWNDFPSAGSDVDGARWDLHILWTPNPRTSLDIGYGDRFFGSTPSLSFKHRKRRSAITAGYSRVLTDTHTLLSTQDIFQESDVLDRPIDPITGDPQEASPIRTRLDDDIIVNEIFNAAYSLFGRRTTLALNGSYSKQISQNTRIEDKFLRYGVTLNRQISRLLSGDASLNWHREEDGEDNTNSNTWYFRIGVSRELSRTSRLRLAYGHADRDSDQVDDSYVENRLNLSISVDL